MATVTLERAIDIVKGAIHEDFHDIAILIADAALSAAPNHREVTALRNIARDRKRLFEARSSLLAYRSNTHSQNGEDGILSEILGRLMIDDGWFCEFGAWDGVHLSNSFSLAKKGWKGVYIEGDPDKFADLTKTCAAFPEGALHPILAYVDHQAAGRTLDDLLATTPIPKDFGVLSIDIDGYDHQVWSSLRTYTPTVVIIEVNSTIAPPERHINTPDRPGTSFQAMADLALAKGYVPVCHTGNLIAVHRDAVGRLGLPPDTFARPELLFLKEFLSVDLDALAAVGQSL